MQIDQTVKRFRREWRRLGVDRGSIDEMAAELAADLSAAAADAQPAESVTGPDPRELARTWAAARGVIRPRPRLLTTAAAALLGAVPGAGFALFIAYGLSSEPMAEIFGGNVVRVGENAYQPALSPPLWLLLPLYALGAAFAYAGAVAGAAAVLHLRGDLAAEATARSLAKALPVATVLAIIATISFASTQDFSTDFTIVVADAGVAASVLAASAAAVRAKVLRRNRPTLAQANR